MDEIGIDHIKKQSIKGLISLTSRTIILQAINFLGYLFITIFLEKKEFGLFILIAALIDILSYFSDIGLAAALIQKKEKPSLKEIRSTFTIQQILVLFLVIIILTLSPLIRRFYQLSNEVLWLLYSFVLAFFLSSLKTIPSILLERKLEFSKIVTSQFIETISFNLVVVLLAWKGFGIKSYTLAVLIRSFLGVLTLYYLAPWPIGFNFSFNVLKRLLKFGIPYQLNSLLAVVKDKFMILLLAKIIGSEGVALIGWAEKWATMPLRYILDNTIKIVFPTFSRLQHDKQRLKIAIEKTLYFLSIFLFPALIGISLIANPIINIIPRYLKWQPALLSLYFYCLASLGGSLAVLLTTIFNAIGKIKITFKLMIFWTISTWLLTPLLAIKFNFVGVPLAVMLVNITAFSAILILRKYIKIDFFNQIKEPLVASLLMFLLIFFLRKYFPLNLLGLFLLILLGGISYIAIIFLLNKKRILAEIRILINEIRNKVR